MRTKRESNKVVSNAKKREKIMSSFNYVCSKDNYDITRITSTLIKKKRKMPPLLLLFMMIMMMIIMPVIIRKLGMVPKSLGKRLKEMEISERVIMY